MTSPTTISPVGLALIERFEGFEPDWYVDPVGVRTIGFGWTGELPAGFAAPLTERSARALLGITVQPYVDAVLAAVRVPLAQHELDALASFTYNLGPNALRRSTLLRKLNAGDRAGAAGEFAKWVRAGGRVLRGLVKRRDAEADLFRGPVTPSALSASAPSTRRAVRAVHQRDTDLPDRTLGALTFYDADDGVVLTLQLLEPPDRDNARGGPTEAGRILPGTYAVTPHHTARFPWSWRIEDRHGRAAVLYHVGNWTRDTRGCPLVGLSRRDLDGDRVEEVASSVGARDAMNAVLGRTHPTEGPTWTVEVRDPEPAPAPSVGATPEGEATRRALAQMARLDGRPPVFL